MSHKTMAKQLQSYVVGYNVSRFFDESHYTKNLIPLMSGSTNSDGVIILKSRVATEFQKVGNCFYKNALKMTMTVVADVIGSDNKFMTNEVFRNFGNAAKTKVLRRSSRTGLHRSHALAKLVLTQVRTLCFWKLHQFLGSEKLKSLFRGSALSRLPGQTLDSMNSMIGKYATFAAESGSSTDRTKIEQEYNKEIKRYHQQNERNELVIDDE